MAGLTIRGYARHRGVSHTAVRKALATGRSTASPDGSIDPVMADRQWAGATDLSKSRTSDKSVTRTRRAPDVPSDPFGTTGLDDGLVPALSEGSATRLASGYAASRAAREAYLARLAKLDFEQRSVKLVAADEVRAQIFGLGRRLRDTLMGLPDRLAPVLTGQSDQAAIHRLLTDELMTSLAELSAAPPLRFGSKPERPS